MSVITTLEKKDLARVLHCSVRSIERWLEEVKEDYWPTDLLPPGTHKAGKWLWKEDVVSKWLHPVQHAQQAGTLADLVTHQLIQNKPGLKN